MQHLLLHQGAEKWSEKECRYVACLGSNGKIGTVHMVSQSLVEFRCLDK